MRARSIRSSWKVRVLAFIVALGLTLTATPSAQASRIGGPFPGSVGCVLPGGQTAVFDFSTESWSSTAPRLNTWAGQGVLTDFVRVTAPAGVPLQRVRFAVAATDYATGRGLSSMGEPLDNTVQSGVVGGYNDSRDRFNIAAGAKNRWDVDAASWNYGPVGPGGTRPIYNTGWVLTFSVMDSPTHNLCQNGSSGPGTPIVVRIGNDGRRF